MGPNHIVPFPAEWIEDHDGEALGNRHFHAFGDVAQTIPQDLAAADN